MPHADTRSAVRHRRLGGGVGRGRRAATSISSVHPVDGAENGGSDSWLTWDQRARVTLETEAASRKRGPL